MSRTRVTPKYQTTIPLDIRRRLGIRAGNEGERQLVQEFAVVRVPIRVKNPVAFLSSQTHLEVDAVALIRRARAELF